MCLYLRKRYMRFRKQKREWVVATRLGSMHLGEMIHFYTPVFRRDVLWYGDVRLSGSPSVHPSVFRTFLLHALIY